MDADPAPPQDRSRLQAWPRENIVTLAAIALLIGGLGLPLYAEHATRNLGTIEFHTYYGFYGWTGPRPGTIGSGAAWSGYVPLGEESAVHPLQIPSVFTATLWFWLAAIAASAASLALAPRLGPRKSQLLLAAGAASAVIAAAYFALTFGGAWMHDAGWSYQDTGPARSFAGVDPTDYGVTYSWGPEPGWILLAVGAFLLSSELARRLVAARRSPAPAPAAN